MLQWVGLGISIVAAICLGYLLGSIPRRRRVNDLLATAREEAEQLKREKILEGKQQIQELREELEERMARREEELARIEERSLRREDRLGKKSNYLEKVEDSLRRDEEELEQLKQVGTRLLAEGKAHLERMAGWSQQEARDHLLQLVETESQRFFSRKVEEVERRAKEEAETARGSRDCHGSPAVRGRVRGGERCQLRASPLGGVQGTHHSPRGEEHEAFEALTGVELLVDDTPEMVVLSCFHPLRREVARMALVRLLEDGRIHPAQIEEKVQRAKARLAERIKEEGKKATFDLGLDLHPELATLLGRLRYRTSYSQNQLAHSLEVSWMGKMLADELGMDSAAAKRAGLLHDIGKAVDHEVGPHAVIGAELARRYGETPEVVHAIAAHHEDVEPASVLAVLIQAADSLSAARPWVRQETFERYVQRLHDLEELCRSFPAVQEAYALQAGREVRVMVQPERANDEIAAKLAYDIARAIEEELSYPGEIKVNVIRQTQFTESAR